MNKLFYCIGKYLRGWERYKTIDKNLMNLILYKNIYDNLIFVQVIIYLIVNHIIGLLEFKNSEK